MMASEIWSELRLKKATLDELLAIPADWTAREESQPFSEPDLTPPWQEEPVTRIIKAIVQCAVRDGASDIHIEPQRREVKVHYIVNGERREHLRLPNLTLEPIVARLKIMGELDLTRSVAQWGTIRFQIEGRDYDLKISTHPTALGEKVVLQML